MSRKTCKGYDEFMATASMVQSVVQRMCIVDDARNWQKAHLKGTFWSFYHVSTSIVSILPTLAPPFDSVPLHLAPGRVPVQNFIHIQLLSSTTHFTLPVLTVCCLYKTVTILILFGFRSSREISTNEN